MFGGRQTLSMSSYVRAIYSLTGAHESPASARRILTDELADRVSARTLESVKLLASELVTNRILAGVGPDESMTLEVWTRGAIHFGVLDKCPSLVLSREEPGEGGWSLLLVDRLADRWGMTRSADGTHIWFETEER
jgi:anti-sigma regulatory factor (Ser/Thr protein kinase)